MSPLLVDSSVWIDAFNGRSTVEVGLLNDALDAGEVVLGDLILMEVLQGVRHPRQLRATEQALAAFPCRILGGRERARSAAGNYRLLRAAGLTPRSPIDVLIATFCVEESHELLALDRDFPAMIPHLGLVIRRPAVT